MYANVERQCCVQIGGIVGSCCGNGVVDAGEACDGDLFCTDTCHLTYSSTNPESATGACCIDEDENGDWGDDCKDGLTPSACFTQKTDPEFMLWHSNLTCDFVTNCTGTLGNTTGSCCLLDGFTRGIDDNVTLSQCQGAFEPGLNSTEAACVECKSNFVCENTGPTACSSKFCDVNTLLCVCLPESPTPPDETTVILTQTAIILLSILIPVAVFCLFFFVATLVLQARRSEDAATRREQDTLRLIRGEQPRTARGRLTRVQPYRRLLGDKRS